MFNVNGWICIRESYTEEEENSKLLSNIIDQINSQLALNKAECNEFYDLKVVNGEYYLNITISHNHYDKKPYEFIMWVATIAKGAFGLIYLYNDEDKNSNIFKVLKISKGRVQEQKDHYLSPLNPEIEE